MRRGRWVAAAGLALLWAPLASAEEWFDAYQRGVEALRQGRAARAAEQLERAIRLRPEPGQNLITYGTNRLDRYHPYLRLAEARLRAGEVEKARAALALSEARGKEPADERRRIAAEVDAALARALAAASPPPAASPSAPPPSAAAPSPPPTVAADPTPAPAAVAAPTLAPAPATRLEARATAAPGVHATAVTPAAPPPTTAALAPSLPPPSPVALPASPLVATPSPAAGTAPSDRWWLPTAVLAIAVVAAIVAIGALRSRRGRAVVEGGTVTLPRRTPLPRGSAATPRSPVATPRRTAVFDEKTAAGDTSPLPRRAAAEDAFGPFRLIEPLGKGGMAAVYRAERRGEVVALKRPLSPLLDDPEFLERFLREAEIGRTLHHPNIIRIFERGDVDGVPYFTMELIEGETLQAYVRRVGALPAREAAALMAQIAEALDYAHLKGVVHRDLKPSNIMIADGGMVKVMDYGIARARRFEGLTVTGAFLGTPDYIAPETAEGRGTDARSDLYALGVIFYEVLTGRRPFVGDTPFATLRKHCTEAPTPPSQLTPHTPRVLEAIVLRLLRKDPDERYPGAEELLIELRQFLTSGAA